MTTICCDLLTHQYGIFQTQRLNNLTSKPNKSEIQVSRFFIHIITMSVNWISQYACYYYCFLYHNINMCVDLQDITVTQFINQFIFHHFAREKKHFLPDHLRTDPCACTWKKTFFTWPPAHWSLRWRPSAVKKDPSFPLTRKSPTMPQRIAIAAPLFRPLKVLCVVKLLPSEMQRFIATMATDHSRPCLWPIKS